MYSTRTVALLLGLVVDAYDDVRNSASALLKIFPVSVLGRTTSASSGLRAHIQLALSKAEAFMRLTGRASYADGVGRLYDLDYDRYTPNNDEQTHTRYSIMELLLTRLESDIQMAVSDLSLAVSKAPIHGHLIALRQELIRILGSCTDVW